MQPIEGKLYSPFQKTTRKTVIEWPKISYIDETYWETFDANVNRVRASPGFKVETFRQLVDEVAQVTISNRNYEMFYRGQSVDFLNNQGTRYLGNIPKSTVYPAICRPERKEDGTYKYSIKQAQILKRYDDLEKMVNLVRKKRGPYLNEYFYSLFQHYDIMPTPLIDITQSLRVAATFALRKRTQGYVFVFGLPYPNQSISYYSDLGIVLIKLQNIMPISAKRPRYQEGFLVGKYPIRPIKSQADDLSNRMVAKFLLDNTSGNFWDESFLPMPENILYPLNDEVETTLKEAKEKFLKSHL